MPSKEQMNVPARLVKALSGVDQNHRQIGSGCTRRHVSGVLLVAWRIGDDEFAALGRKETIGHVDCDALFALCPQAVGEQREVCLLADRTVLAGSFDRGKLVLENHLAVVQ